MVLGVLASVLWYAGDREHEGMREAAAREALERLRQEVIYRGALAMADTGAEQGEVTAGAFPAVLDPAWFAHEGGVPRNPLASAERVWVDVAASGDVHDHPPDPVLSDDPAMRGVQGGFWYNAGRGVLRARTPRLESDRATLGLYNRVNHTDLAALPREADVARKSVPISGRLVEPARDVGAATPGGAGPWGWTPPGKPDPRRTLSDLAATPDSPRPRD